MVDWMVNRSGGSGRCWKLRALRIDR